MIKQYKLAEYQASEKMHKIKAEYNAFKNLLAKDVFVEDIPLIAPNLINEILGHCDIDSLDKDTNIGVVYSIEILPFLKHNGFKNVTVLTHGYDRMREAIAQTYDYKYADNILEKETDMKFDIVIGNPPYQNPIRANEQTNQGGGKKMYVSFMEKASNITKQDGIIAMVVPSAVFKTTVYGEFGKGFSSMKDVKVISAQTDVSRYFNVGISIGYFISKKTTEKINAVINGSVTDFNETGFYPLDSALSSIAAKLINNKLPLVITRDKDLTGSGFTTSRFAYLTLGNTKEATNLVWETSRPEELKRLLKTNMFARVAWDGFVVIDKRWYHNFWSALFLHPELNVDMSDDQIMDLYGLSDEEKSIINLKNRTNIVCFD